MKNIKVMLSLLMIIGLMVANTFAAPSAEEIIDQATANLKEVNQISVGIKISTFNEKGNEMAIEAKIEAILPDIVRFTYTKPDFMSGQVMLVDRKAEELKIYMPVTNQIIVTGLDSVSGPGGTMDFNIEDMMAIPDKDDFVFTLVGEENLNGLPNYVIKVQSKDNKTGDQRLWFDKQDVRVTKIELYGKEGKLQTAIELKDVQTDANLSEKSLLKLPEDADVLEQ